MFKRVAIVLSLLAVVVALPFAVAFDTSVIAVQRFLLDRDQIVVGGAVIYPERDWRLSSSREAPNQDVMIFGLLPSRLLRQKKDGYWPSRYFHFVDSKGSYITFAEFDDVDCETERVLASLEERGASRLTAVRVSGLSGLAYSQDQGLTVITVPALRLQVTVDNISQLEHIRIENNSTDQASCDRPQTPSSATTISPDG